MAKFTGHTITSDSALGGKIIEKSLRFNRSGSHRLNRTPASAGNRKTWTKSFWVKRTTEDRRMIHGYYTSGTDVAVISFREYGNFAFYDFTMVIESTLKHRLDLETVLLGHILLLA